mmetsp:Transcript_28272/g.91465  ORF Transcript_28272/g.91465 Transcript_28272/m.91465 type:complete len:250 (+) Transcript_28272:73-822(+)
MAPDAKSARRTGPMATRWPGCEGSSALASRPRYHSRPESFCPSTALSTSTDTTASRLRPSRSSPSWKICISTCAWRPSTVCSDMAWNSILVARSRSPSTCSDPKWPRTSSAFPVFSSSGPCTFSYVAGRLGPSTIRAARSSRSIGDCARSGAALHDAHRPWHSSPQKSGPCRPAYAHEQAPSAPVAPVGAGIASRAAASASSAWRRYSWYALMSPIDLANAAARRAAAAYCSLASAYACALAFSISALG